MNQEIIENHKRFSERKTLYKTYEYDIDKESAFIIEKAQPLYGDILEAGTGKGHFAVALAQAGCRFTTFDISEEQQRFAQLNLQYFGLEGMARFCIENGEYVSFKNKSFDIVFSVNTFHHLVNPYKVLDELIRILIFEGKIIISDFTPKGLAVMDTIHRSEGGTHEVSTTTLSDIARYAAAKDFVIDHAQSQFQDVLILYRQIV